MHAEVVTWLGRCAERINWLGAQVIEVGSLDVNGQARDCVPAELCRTWVGLDLVPGAGVTVVGDAVEYLHDAGARFDVAVCTEVLEHSPRWAEIVNGLLRVLRPEGWLILTCAGPDRLPHAADGSPGGPHPGEYYRNLSLTDIATAIDVHPWTLVMGEYGAPGDTRMLIRKLPTVDIQPFNL